MLGPGSNVLPNREELKKNKPKKSKFDKKGKNQVLKNPDEPFLNLNMVNNNYDDPVEAFL
jgi:hypothetical protein